MQPFLILHTSCRTFSITFLLKVFKLRSCQKNAWITGASSGIGKALAIKFAKEGWQVAASARRENLLKDLNNQNPNIHPFPLNVKNEDEAKNIFQNIIKKFKTVDISVFCTGIHDPDAEKKLSSEKIREIMETNFFGTLNCIMAVNTYFREKKKWSHFNSFFCCRLQRLTSSLGLLCI